MGAMSKVSELIRDLRRVAGLSQAEISRRTGIPQPRISRWEAGAVAAGADDALKLLQLHKSMSRKRKAVKQPAGA